MSENTRKPLSEQHHAWVAARAALFVPDTPEEAAYIAAHPIDPNEPGIPGEQVTRMLAYGAKCARDAVEECAALAERDGFGSVANMLRKHGAKLAAMLPPATP